MPPVSEPRAKVGDQKQPQNSGKRARKKSEKKVAPPRSRVSMRSPLPVFPFISDSNARQKGQFLHHFSIENQSLKKRRENPTRKTRTVRRRVHYSP